MTHIVDEIPRTGSGKIMRFKLVEALNQDVTARRELASGDGPQVPARRSLGVVVQPVLHVGGDDRLVAAVAVHRGVEIVPAFEMAEEQRRFSLGSQRSPHCSIAMNGP